MALHVLYTTDVWIADDFEYQTPTTQRLMAVFAGYTFYDSCLVIFYRNEWSGFKEMIIHHFVALLSFVHLVKEGYAHNMGCVCPLMEITSLFINNRWFLDTTGLRKTNPPLYIVNGALITILWFFSRILLPGWAGYMFVFRLRDQLWGLGALASSIVTITYIVAYSLQFIWFQKILRGMFKALGWLGDGGKKE
jgi:hypothetical protein